MDTKALRQKILDLAIRGKLVPQDPNDEPASVLLERIRAEKQQMVKDGKLKAKDIKNDTVIFKGDDNLHYEQFADGTVKCIVDEIPFDIPDSWSWCRGYSCFKGMESLKPNGEYFDYIDIDAIDNKSHKVKEAKHILVKEAPSRASRKIENGSVLFSLVRPYLENIAYIDEELSHCIASTGFYICNSNGILNPHYMFRLMTSNYVINGLNEFMKGDNSPSIKKEDIENFLFPIPPIQEQICIDREIEVYLKIVDVINDNENKLTASINSVKSKILDLAIRGKLVPQYPNDEPASVLLERIRAEKEELIKQGKIKRDKKESVIFKGDDNSYYEKIGNDVACIDDEIPFELPETWIWCRGYSCFSGMDTKRPSGEYFDYIDIDSIDNKAHKVKQPKHILVKDAPNRASRAVQTGSVLLSFVRPYLENIAYIDERLSKSIASTGFYVCNSNGMLYPPFMYYLMTSDYVIKGLNQYMKGDNSPSISKDNIEHWLYPIPPINEQKEIFKKIENLLNLVVVIEKSFS